MEIKTLGDAWAILKSHGLDGTYCPHCDQFSQARVLQCQDDTIKALLEALKAMYGSWVVHSDDSVNMAIYKMAQNAIKQAEEA